MQLTFSCSSSSNEIEPLKPEGEDTPLEKDEYTFMNVEYRKWQNGTFQAWTTADSRETRTIDNMNWLLIEKLFSTRRELPSPLLQTSFIPIINYKRKLCFYN